MPDVQQPAIDRPVGRWAAPALTLATFLSALAGFAYGPFLPAIARDLGLDVATLGQLSAAAALAAAPLALIAGPLADRWGCRRGLLLALASLAAGALATALALGLPTLLAAALAGALGRATATPLAQAVAGARLAGDARRRALGWLTAGTTGAVVVGVPLLTAVAAALGWRAAFAALALAAAANAALLGRRLGPDGPPAAAGTRPGRLLAAYRPLVAHAPTTGLIGGTLLGVAGTSVVLTYLGAFLAERHGSATAQIGLAYLAVGAGALTGALAAGGRLGARPLRPLLIGVRAASAALVGAALLPPLPAPAAVGLLMLGGALAAVSTVATATLLTGETPAGRAATMALNAAAVGLGSALGAGLGGLLLATGGYPALGLGPVALYAAAGLLVWWSRPGRAAAPRATGGAPAG
jgi:predicted MFS family arabinose efflux permease